MNYNIEKPKSPPKKYFNYQNIFYITFVLGLIYIFSRVFVRDAVYYKMLAEEKILTDPTFGYSNFIKFLGSSRVAFFIDLLGRISIPLSIFCLFLCFKNNKLNVIVVLIVSILMEIFYDYFNYGKFNFINNSEFLIIALSVGFFYLWDIVKRVKLRWLYRICMSILFIFASVYFNIRNSLLYSFFIVSLAYFDPVRLNQAVFGAICMFANGSTMVSSIFIYFYDEDFNRNKNNIYFLLFLPLFSILIFILRNKILG